MKVETYTNNKEQDRKIGDRLKTIRTANELSQEEFASRICCHPYDYARVENAVEIFSSSMLKLISYEFNVSLSWIMQGVPIEGDPGFCTTDTDGTTIFNSCISIQEFARSFAIDNGMSMWSDNVEMDIDNIHNSIRYIFKMCGGEYTDKKERYIDDKLRDAISLANYDGYNAGWKTAIQLIRGLFNTSLLSEEPPAISNSNMVISPEIVSAARKTKPRNTTEASKRNDIMTAPL